MATPRPGRVGGGGGGGGGGAAELLGIGLLGGGGILPVGGGGGGGGTNPLDTLSERPILEGGGGGAFRFVVGAGGGARDFLGCCAAGCIAWQETNQFRAFPPVRSTHRCDGVDTTVLGDKVLDKLFILLDLCFTVIRQGVNWVQQIRSDITHLMP